jgi:4-amino-4-deoxy-L-arabinose transferase-like glycosyltransferase
MKMHPRRTYIFAGACLLLLVFGLQLASTVKQESLTWDEGDHIFAGYMSWKTHDYGLNPEHPPLMKMLATVPLLGLPLKVPEPQHRFFKTESYMSGKALLFGNAPAYSVETLTFRVRMAAGIVAILLGLLVFLATREMFGLAPAFIALVLLTFEPNILAHGAFVTTDAGVSCFFFAAVYAFYRYCKSPSVGRLVVTGVAAGLALASKHSAVLLLPMLVALAGCEVVFRFRTDAARTRRAQQMVAALAVIGVLAVGVLWAFYGFRYNARPDGLRLDPTLADYVLPLKPMEAKGILSLARFHILPESYLYGLADVRAMANGMQSFIFGKVYEHGVWFYFPAVLLIKSTIGWLGMVLLAVAAVVVGRLRRWREILFLTIPAAIYLIVAMGSSLNIGARHILPVYVFLCVFAAGGCWALVESKGQWNKRWSWIVGVLLICHVVSSARAYPNYMAYSSEFWGGPTKTYKYLTDSNTDWAQQLLAVKRYTDEHGIKECWFAYFADPFLTPQDYGIPCKPLPVYDSFVLPVQHPVPATITGPVFLSAGDWTGFEFGSKVLNPYRNFEDLKPVARIQDGVFVYEGTFQVPLASSLSFVQESDARLKAKDFAGAVAAAQQAVSIAPEGFQPLLALGDALEASGRGSEAKAVYERALEVVKTMEPEAQEVWGPVVRKKIGS